MPSISALFIGPEIYYTSAEYRRNGGDLLNTGLDSANICRWGKLQTLSHKIFNMTVHATLWHCSNATAAKRLQILCGRNADLTWHTRTKSGLPSTMKQLQNSAVVTASRHLDNSMFKQCDFWSFLVAIPAIHWDPQWRWIASHWADVWYQGLPVRNRTSSLATFS